jgi:hypothetical protein
MEEEAKNEVALVQQDQNALLERAESWIKSGLLPTAIDKPEKAVVIVLKGKELGLEPMASFELIDVIMGKPALKPKGMSAILRKGGVETQTIEDFEPIKNEKGEIIDYRTIIRFYRGRIEEDVKYLYSDAQKLGLTSKDNWKKQPAIMMYWRCFSKGANRVAADLINGLYTTEELASFTKGAPQIEITEEGDAIVIS